MRRVSTKLWTPSLFVEAYNKTLFYYIITHTHLISHTPNKKAASPPPTKKQPPNGSCLVVDPEGHDPTTFGL